MVNVTHNADNRRSSLQILFLLLILLQKLLDHIYLDLLLTDNIIINGNVLSFLVGDLCINSHNLSLQEQLLDDRRRLQLHLIRQILNRKGFRQSDHLDLLLRLFLLFLRLDKSAGFVLILQCSFVLFVHEVLLGLLVTLLAVPTLFFISMLLGILNRGICHETFTLSFRLFKSIVLPAIASFRTSVTSRRSAAI